MVADGPRREIIITGQHTKSNTLLFDHDLLNYMEPIFLPLCSTAIVLLNYVSTNQEIIFEI